jgi:hypothetical protein
MPVGNVPGMQDLVPAGGLATGSDRTGRESNLLTSSIQPRDHNPRLGSGPGTRVFTT